MGGTIFDARNIDIRLKKNYFIPSSTLTRWRRELTSQLTAERLKYYPKAQQEHTSREIETETPYELTHDPSVPVMICKHCIRRQLGICLKEKSSSSLRTAKELTLRMANGATFSLDFDCKNCFMKLYLQ